MGKTRKKGRGLFGKTRKHSVIAAADKYEKDGWKVMLAVINDRELELDEEWSV